MTQANLSQPKRCCCDPHLQANRHQGELTWRALGIQTEFSTNYSTRVAFTISIFKPSFLL